ncbi:MAG: hypothetical protein ACXVAU_00265 [Mucilaginibacter sp.]
MNIDRVKLLQPISPFRTDKHVEEAISLFNEYIDTVVSVKKINTNPYYILIEENEEGWLFKSKEHLALRRQAVPIV